MRLLLLLITCSTMTFGQNIIKGKVINTYDNKPLASCRIIADSREISKTDDNGQFEVTVDIGVKAIELRFSSCGIIKIPTTTNKDIGTVYMFWGFYVFDSPRKGDFVYPMSDSIVARGTYKRHRLNGQFIGGTEKGKFKIEGLYKNGKKIGLWTYYRPDGQKIQYIFKDDITVLN